MPNPVSGPQVPLAFQVVPTPDPNERAIITILDQNLFTRGTDFPVLKKTLYGKWNAEAGGGKQLAINAYANSPGLYGDYLYVKQVDAPSGYLGFFWGKNKTDEQKTIPFDSYEVTVENVPWPSVLRWIQFNEETSFPLSQNFVGANSAGVVTAPRWLVRRGYLPAQSLTTTVRIKEYLSPTPFPDFLMESDEPQPTEVSWDLIGSSGNMGKCLHPKIETPKSNGSFRVAYSSGNIEASTAQVNTSQIFPATNHQDWQEYTINSVTKNEQGMYHRIQRTFVPPSPSQVTRLSS